MIPFYVRPVQKKDLQSLLNLSRQFILLNLPSNVEALESIIEKSLLSFEKKLNKFESEFLFVLVRTEDEKLVGSSLVKSKHGSPEDPHNYFSIKRQERFSPDLGIGFIHQLLELHSNEDGPTEFGGLLVDGAFRGHPNKLGKLISLSRFLYVGSHPELFEKEFHCELAPPLTSDGRSEFWEAIGRRFTGLPYQEADRLSHENKEFIKSLFPSEPIYLSLVDSRARLVMGQVSEETKGARYLMEKLGFKYKNHVDPFDGGPHLGCKSSEVPLIQNLQKLTLDIVKESKQEEMPLQTLVLAEEGSHIICFWNIFKINKDEIQIPESFLDTFNLSKKTHFYKSYA